MTNSKKIERWFIFKDNHLLLLENNTIPTNTSIQHLHVSKRFKIFEDASTIIYCDQITDALDGCSGKWVPLKEALSLIGDAWYVVATKARGILTWNEMHQFCGRCANQTERSSEKFERTCSQCRHIFYPRISPSIIVLVKKGDQILMARSPHFPRGTYGLIAGFVETGESVEDAVHREVMEEVRIEINNLHYFGSQAWPFPDSLMLGFYADYNKGDIVINEEELEEAGWFNLDNLPGYPSTNVSIASRLINSMFNKNHA